MALIINGERVEDGVLFAEFGSVKGYFERLGNVSCCERDEEFRGYAKQNVIARVLLMQHAMKVGEAPPAEQVDAALAKLVAEHGGEGRFLAAVGASPEQMDLVRRDLELNLRVEGMVERLMAAETAPGEEELKAFYREHIGTFTTAEELRASHISKAPPRGEQRQAVYETFREVRRKLLEGADFDELAREHSDRGHEQIDLGFFKRGDLPDEFETVAFSMNVGEISPVFLSAVGVHIVKVTDRRPPTARPFDEVREEVAAIYFDVRKQRGVAQLVKKLQAEAKIEEVATEQEVGA